MAPQTATLDLNGDGSKGSQLRRTVDRLINDLASDVDRVRASVLFKQYLQSQAHFHDYSILNCMLIMRQRPSATKICGFKQWLKMGRHVNKGEHGIKIMAPITFKKKNVDSGEPDTGISFRCVSVFDVSQTDGDTLPVLCLDESDVWDDCFLADIVAVTNSRNITLTFETIQSGAYGISKGGAIIIDNTHPTGNQAKTLIHELAHEALHKKNARPKGMTRDGAELEAEAVAYTVCSHFDIDSSFQSCEYIAMYNGQSKGLKESMNRISTCSRELIKEILAVAHTRKSNS